MIDYKQRAGLYFIQGYNCAQSVLMAFSDEIGLSQGQAARLASSFGGGMGQLREVCGAVSAMFMVEGLVQGYPTPDDPASKKDHYGRVRALAEKFTQLHGTIVCRELLSKTPDDNQRPHWERPCLKYVMDAAGLIGAQIHG